MIYIKKKVIAEFFESLMEIRTVRWFPLIKGLARDVNLWWLASAPFWRRTFSYTWGQEVLITEQRLRKFAETFRFLLLGRRIKGWCARR